MKRCLLLGCSNTKAQNDDELPAIERYDGPLFRVLRRYMRKHSAEYPADNSIPNVYVLSAEFGLIPGNHPIPYYNRKMTPQRAAELRPEDPGYAYTVGFYEDRNGESGSAERTLEGLLDRHPAYADAYLLLGSLYERQGKTEAARALYARALEAADLNRRQEYQVASRLQALGGAVTD